LVNQGIIKSPAQKTRDEYLSLAKDSYYSTTSTVFDSWKTSDLRKWLVDNNVIKSDFEASRDKYAEMVRSNYKYANDELWSSWTDSDLRNVSSANDAGNGLRNSVFFFPY